MSGILQGRVAAVTGGASGIGLAIAKLFASEDARVATLDLKAHDAASADGLAVAADVGDEQAVDAAFAEIEQTLGAPDILVNCAGTDVIAPLQDVTLAIWEGQLRVHMTGTFLCCRRALPAMRKAGFGRIINTSSQLGHRGAPGMVPYCAAKAGILGFTKALAYEVAADGVTVNCLAPGPISTPLVDSLPREVVDAIVAQVPLGRLGRVEEVAVAALMLAHPDGGYFHGASLNMNGGHYMI